MPTKIKKQDIGNAEITAEKLAIPTTKGDLLGFDTLPNRVPVGTNGQVLTADNTTALGVKWSNNAVVSTTKGDLIGFSDKAIRIPIGKNGQIFVVDLTQESGVRWVSLTDLIQIPLFVDSETPTGEINGTNTTFTTVNLPKTGSLHLYKNGLRQQNGEKADYILSENKITFNIANIPQTGDIILADYRY